LSREAAVKIETLSQLRDIQKVRLI
jgi:hypothetical protein